MEKPNDFILMNQTAYATRIIDKFGMKDSKPLSIPMIGCQMNYQRSKKYIIIERWLEVNYTCLIELEQIQPMLRMIHLDLKTNQPRHI